MLFVQAQVEDINLARYHTFIPLGAFVVGLCPWVSLLWGHLSGWLCCGAMSLGVFVVGSSQRSLLWDHLPGCVCSGPSPFLCLFWGHLPGVFVVLPSPGCLCCRPSPGCLCCGVCFVCCL